MQNVHTNTDHAATTDRAAMLRPATAQDLVVVERLLSVNQLPLEGVRAALPNFVVAEAAGEIVGVAGLELCSENALLRSVAVAEPWRAHGIGRALVARLVAEAEARGIPALYLLTTTAEHYFPSLGFRTITRAAVPSDIQATEEFRESCPASAAVMRRSLQRAS